MDLQELETDTVGSKLLDDLNPEQINRLHFYVNDLVKLPSIVDAIFAEKDGYTETAEAIKRDGDVVEDVDYILYGSKH